MSNREYDYHKFMNDNDVRLLQSLINLHDEGIGKAIFNAKYVTRAVLNIWYEYEQETRKAFADVVGVSNSKLDADAIKAARKALGINKRRKSKNKPSESEKTG